LNQINNIGDVAYQILVTVAHQPVAAVKIQITIDEENSGSVKETGNESIDGRVKPIDADSRGLDSAVDV